MVKLISSLNREAFRGLWRDHWQRSKMSETVGKIESGSLKEICKAFLKVEVEMNWKALSEEFSKHRPHILNVFGKGSAASEVYRDLVFFSRELNPNFLQDGCELPSEATFEMLKLDESSRRMKDEQEIDKSSTANGNDSSSQTSQVGAKKMKQTIFPSDSTPTDSEEEVTARMTLVDWRWAAQNGFWLKSEKRWNVNKGGFQGYLHQKSLSSQEVNIDVAFSGELKNETKQKSEDTRGPERSIDIDSTLVWVLYRKQDWWPAQVVHTKIETMFSS